MPRALIAIVLFLAADHSRAQNLCPGNGLNLATTGGRLGDPFSLTLSGPPNLSGLLGVDLAIGPSWTPIGTLCLGLTPALQILPFTLDPAGSFALSGVVPPNPALAGLATFMQAAASDLTFPGGVALSNGATASLRSPHVHFVLTMYAYLPPYGPPLPGRWVPYDVLTDSYGGIVNFPAHIASTMAVPSLGWMAFLLGNGTVTLHDSTTGANLASIVLPQPPTYHTRLSVSGSTLFVHDPGSSTVPAVVRAYALPSAALLWSVTLPGSAGKTIVPPEGGFIYATYGSTVLPINAANGALLPQFELASPTSVLNEWIFEGSLVYCLMGLGGGTASLNAIDINTQTTLFPAAVPLPVTGGVATLRFGPGTVGPSLFVRNWTQTAQSILQISPTTFLPTAAPVALPGGGYAAMELSNGGTEWLLVTTSPTCSGFMLSAMHAATHAITTVGCVPWGVIPHLRPIRSASFNKAYLGCNGNQAVVRFDTDPTTTILPVMNTPLWPVGLELIVD